MFDIIHGLGLWVWGVWDDYKRSDNSYKSAASDIQIVTSELTVGEDVMAAASDGWVIGEESAKVLTTGTPIPTPTLRATATAVNAVPTVAVTQIYATPESIESGLLHTLAGTVEDVGEGFQNTFSLPDSSTGNQHPIIQDGISEAACYEGQAAGRRVSPACAQFFAGAKGGTGR